MVCAQPLKSMFFQLFSLMDYNVKVTFKRLLKNVKPLNLDALISMVWLGLVWVHWI